MGKHLGSPVYQVNKALNRIFHPGTSRHKEKAAGRDTGRIYGIRTMKTYVEDGSRFAKWVKKEYGIRDIRKITPEMARAYIDRLAALDRSGGYIGRIKAALGKLSEALHGTRWDLGTAWHSDRRPDRAYSATDARRIYQDMGNNARDRQVGDVAQLQTIGGLRVSEAAQLRGRDIDVERCTLHLERGTKGGRVREVKLAEKYRPYLQELKDQAENHQDGCVFKGRGSLADRVERAVNAACKRLGIKDRGTHAFRGTFANTRYQQYIASDKTELQARRLLAADLGHGRVQVTYSYVA